MLLLLEVVEEAVQAGAARIALHAMVDTAAGVEAGFQAGKSRQAFPLPLL